MCVLIEEPDFKIVQLPKFVTTIKRGAALELEMSLQSIKATWDSASQSFLLSTQEGTVEVKIITEEIQETPQKPPNAKKVVSAKEISRVVVGGRVVVTIEFVFDDDSTSNLSYILSGERVYHHYQGTWQSAPITNGYIGGGWVAEPNGLPPSNVTPPPTAGDNGGQNAE